MTSPSASSLESHNEALAELYARTKPASTEQNYSETFLYARENLLAITYCGLYGVPCFLGDTRWRKRPVRSKSFK